MTWRDVAHDNAGGCEVMVDQLARALVADGHRVTVVCGKPIAATSRPYAVVANGRTYSQYLTAPLRHRRLPDVDVLIDVANGIPFFAALWRRGPTVALVTHVHGDEWRLYFPAPIAAVGMRLERVGLGRLYRNREIVTISPSARDALASIGAQRDRIHVIPLGTEPPDAPHLPKSRTPTFVAVGRLSPTKRIDLLIEMWEDVHPRTGGELIIVGAGEPEVEADLRSRAGSNVRFAGRVDEHEKRRLLDEARLLLHPSMQEGWGLVIDEAAQSGTPAIGFDVPGVCDAIDDRVTGRLAATRDAFVSAWLELAADDEQRDRMGAAARERASDSTWADSATALLTAVEQSMRASRSSTKR